MITEASISFSDDGAVLMVLPETGMDVLAKTFVRVAGGTITVRQGDKTYVSLGVDNQNVLRSIARSDDINIAEVGEDSFVFHENVHMET